MRTTDVLLSLPFLLVAVAVNRAVPSAGVASLGMLLGFLSWATLARITRAKVLSVRELPYVEAARAIGARTPYILFRHVLPNVLGPALVVGTTMVSDMIIIESAMSFLGLGITPPEATWGSMLYEGRDMKSVHAGMKITNAEFDATIGDLKATLDKLGVPTEEQKELLAVIETARPQIAEKR
jgi:ABC-type dipeptide/oligopeptide/nickel transport system permease subunit